MAGEICPNSVPYSDGDDTKAFDVVIHDVGPNVSVEGRASRERKADDSVQKTGFSSSNHLFRRQQIVRMKIEISRRKKKKGREWNVEE